MNIFNNFFYRPFFYLIFCLLLVSCNEYTVTKTTDTHDGYCSAADCSLREAISAANASPGIDVVTIPPGTYNLKRGSQGEDANAGGDLDIQEALIINGSDRDNTIIDGNLRDRVIQAHVGLLYLQNITIKRGYTTEGGAGILVQPGASLQMQNVMIRENHEAGPDGPSVSNSPPSRGLGGGIYSAGNIDLDNVVFEQNQNTSTFRAQAAAGAGLAVSGPMSRIAIYTGEIINVNLNNVRFYNNRTAGPGGGLYVGDYAVAQLNNLDMEHNASYTDSGGALYFSDYSSDSASLSLTDSRIYDNYAGWRAGGMYLHGNAQIHRSSIFDNHSEGSGGGVEASDGVLLRDSTINNNTAKGNGGGVYSNYDVTLENTTLSANTAKFGGGIHVNFNADIVNSTIAYNHAKKKGGGISVTIVGGPRIVNSIVANNSKDQEMILKLPMQSLAAAPVFNINNCHVSLHQGEAFPPISLGYNLANDNSCGFTAVGDIIADPLLEPLTNNGGPTLTHAIPYGSPAVDAGSNGYCTNGDQRGYPRPVAADFGSIPICDIGAYEWRLLPPAVLQLKKIR